MPKPKWLESVTWSSQLGDQDPHLGGNIPTSLDLFFFWPTSWLTLRSFEIRPCLRLEFVFFCRKLSKIRSFSRIMTSCDWGTPHHCCTYLATLVAARFWLWIIWNLRGVFWSWCPTQIVEKHVVKLFWLFPPKQWHPGSGGGFFCSQQKSLAALARRHPVFLLGSRRKNHGVTPPTDVGTFWLCGIADLFASNEIGLGVYHPSSPVHCKSWERFVITLLKEIVDVPLMVVKKKLLAFRKIEHHLWVKGKICKDFAPDF